LKINKTENQALSFVFLLYLLYLSCIFILTFLSVT